MTAQQRRGLRFALDFAVGLPVIALTVVALGVRPPFFVTVHTGGPVTTTSQAKRPQAATSGGSGGSFAVRFARIRAGMTFDELRALFDDFDESFRNSSVPWCLYAQMGEAKRGTDFTDGDYRATLDHVDDSPPYYAVALVRVKDHRVAGKRWVLFMPDTWWNRCWAGAFRMCDPDQVYVYQFQ